MKMRQILIKRTHCSYLALLEALTAKNDPISGSKNWSRTRIHGQGLSPLQSTPQNDPGMSFRFSRKGSEGALPRPDSLAGAPGARKGANNLASASDFIAHNSLKQLFPGPAIGGA
jgi:hypothetical protein